MKLNARRVAYGLVALAMMFFSSSGFALRTGTGNCAVCFGMYDPSTNFAVTSCVPPESWGWGTDNCHIVCTGYDSVGGCQCLAEGYGCLYVEVNG